MKNIWLDTLFCGICKYYTYRCDDHNSDIGYKEISTRTFHTFQNIWVFHLGVTVILWAASRTHMLEATCQFPSYIYIFRRVSQCGPRDCTVCQPVSQMVHHFGLTHLL